MADQVSKPQPKYIKCIKSPQFKRLEVGKVYELRDQDFGDYLVVGGGRELGWFHSSCFQEMPPTFDPVEHKLRAILTTPVHDCTCKKCGAPTPCKYHP